MVRAEKKIGLYLIDSIRDVENLKRLYPHKEKKLDEIQFDIELNLLRFARGKDVPIEKLDIEWAERLQEVMEERKGLWV